MNRVESGGMAGLVPPPRRRRSWAAFFGAVEGQCCICGDPIPPPSGDKGRVRAVCDDCTEVRQAIFDAVRWVLTKNRCSVCPRKVMRGERHCARHQFLPDPCLHEGCTERIPRRSGRGKFSLYCPTHRKAKG
jgi:hypothetical protein